MRFLVDAQLPPALARWIETQGHEAEHVYDFAGDGASDRSLWLYATNVNAVIISPGTHRVPFPMVEGWRCIE